jgi:hypothetical protein
VQVTKTYKLTYDEIVQIFRHWEIDCRVNRADPTTPTTPREQADYFTAIAEALNEETN